MDIQIHLLGGNQIIPKEGPMKVNKAAEKTNGIIIMGWHILKFGGRYNTNPMRT